MTSAEALFAAMWKGALLLLYERERCSLCETDCVLRVGPIDLSALKCLHNDARDFLNYSIIAKLDIFIAKVLSTLTKSQLLPSQNIKYVYSGTGRRTQRVLSFFIRNKALYDCYKHEIASFFIHARAFVLARADGRDALAHVKKTCSERGCRSLCRAARII